MPRTTRDLRRSNRTALLRELLFEGPTSRQALADKTSLSAGTVGLVVTDLLDEGWIEEVGLEESGGGRPRTILRVAADRGLSIGVDLGERGLRVEAVDLAWQRRADVFVDLNARDSDPAMVVDQIAHAVSAVISEASLPDARILGVGVSVPGVVERTAESRVYAPGFGWDGLPLGRLLREVIDGPVLVDNGAKAMGQAELWFGAGKGATDAVVALLGIGVGSAFFTEGRLYRGARSSAGEWGHIPIVMDGEPCRCGSLGCLEAYIGETAILRHWDDLLGRETDTTTTDPARIDDLFAAVETEPEAAATTEYFARHLGAGIASLVNLFNPETIVLAGSVGLRITPTVLEKVRDAAARYSLRQPYERVRITTGQLGHDAVALGAATLVVDHHLERGFRFATGLPTLASETAV